MARNISNVPSSMVHADAAPWHGVSVEIPPKATAKQIQKLAGMNFEVGVSPAFYKTKSGKTFKTDRTRILYREDTGMWLDDVGPDYTPIQNDVAFDFVKSFVDAGEMRIETAGVFGQGQKCWLLASTGENFTVGGRKGKGRDVVESKLLIYIPHQYQQAIQILWTGICVVCANTLQAALSGAEDKIRILHFREYSQEVKDSALEKVGLAHNVMKNFEADAKLMAEVPVEDDVAVELLTDVFNVRNVVKVMELFGGKAMGAELPSRSGTAWGLFNSVTEFVDHHTGQRTTDQAQRLERAWFGIGEREKRNAHAKIVEYAQQFA